MGSSAQRDYRNTVLLAATTASGIALAAYFLSRRQRRRAGALATFGRYKYPRSRTCDASEVFWGEKVLDPFRWLEDADSPETTEWINAQNTCTDRYMDSVVAPEREAFRNRMTALYNYDKYSSPSHFGPYYFFTKKAGLEPQGNLYKQKGLDGEPEILIDMNAMSEDGTAAFKGSYCTHDGSLMAYCISRSGADWQTIHVKDVETGKDLPDQIPWSKWGAVAWPKDAPGFFYCKYPPPSSAAEGKSAGTEHDIVSNCRIFYHVLGSDTEADQLVLDAAPDDKWQRNCEVTDDFSMLLITAHDSCDDVNRLYYHDLTKFDGRDVSTLGPLVKVIDNFEAKYDVIANDGRTFYFLTNKDAPRSKVVSMELLAAGSAAEADPAALAAVVEAQTVVIPEDPSAVLSRVYAVGANKMVLRYMRDAHEVLEICNLDGSNRRPVKLPSVGAIEGLFARRFHDEVFFKFVNFQDPGTTYRCVLKEGDGPGDDGRVEMSIFRRTEVPGLVPEDFETKQVRYKSKDGTSIPMFIVGRKGQRGKAPCLLYGYGGFNISIMPSFRLAPLMFIKYFGGRFCVANIRGGGEYGEDWHKAGTKLQKQNVFDDFLAAADYLCTIKITTESQLAINGASNGGTLVGACINQQPHKFACAIAQVGVMDMLRFHKFTIGHAWCSDYGNADEDADEFRALRAYSPAHNVRPDAGRYPATLVLTGDHDDRVVPLHSYKYIAALQETIGSRKGEANPLLIRIDTKSGHGAGKPTAKVIEEASEVYAFVAKHTGAVWSDLP